jgi:glycosyltransferase involved in cell wall biosynthesis
LGIKCPRKGTIIFVGAHFKVRRWYEYIKPSRVIIIYNVLGQGALDDLYKRSLKICKRVEVVHISEWMKNSSLYEGVIHYSPINIDKFKPAPRKTYNQFTVGRLSRDTQDKFSENDPSLFREIVGFGCRVKLMGATILGPSLDGHKGIEILPASAEEPVRFLNSLDCFIYRTHDSWTEPFGRVVMEAMACGLPVVCENRGGYVELIEHEKNGFLFSTTEEAVNIIKKLESDRKLCRRIGEQARLTMESVYIGEQLDKRTEYYLSSNFP